MTEQILNIIRKNRLDLLNEKNLQQQLETLFSESGIKISREHRLDSKNIVDFFVDGWAIEVKIKSPAKTIYRQCERYCKFQEVKNLILITSKAMGFPKEINGKPCYVINISKAWL